MDYFHLGVQTTTIRIEFNVLKLVIKYLLKIILVQIFACLVYTILEYCKMIKNM